MIPTRITCPVAVLVVLLLAGCGTSFRAPAMPREEALNRGTPLHLVVVKVWSLASSGLDHDRDALITHWIECDVLDGSPTGRPITLPYDEWNTGRKAPEEGDRLTVAPADWVRRAKNTQGRPYGGF